MRMVLDLLTRECLHAEVRHVTIAIGFGRYVRNKLFGSTIVFNVGRARGAALAII